jgi:hypothetical protein
LVPHTINLLSALGLEIAFFSHHSAEYLRARSNGPLSTNAQFDLFAGSIRTFFSDHQIYKVISELFTHEVFVSEMLLRKFEPKRQTMTGSLCWLGELALRDLEVDVLKLCATSFDKNSSIFDLSACSRAHTLAYWRPKNEDRVTFIEVDAITKTIFSLVNAGWSVDVIAREISRLGLYHCAPEDVTAFLAEAADKGIVSVRVEDAVEGSSCSDHD